jgi:hypothetical protein
VSQVLLGIQVQSGIRGVTGYTGPSIPQIYNVGGTTNSLSYENISSSFIFRGSLNVIILSINSVAFKSVNGTSYSLRIIDVLNANTVISEVTGLVNEVDVIIAMPINILNIPINPSIFQLQGLLIGGGGSRLLTVNSLELIYR